MTVGALGRAGRDLLGLLLPAACLGCGDRIPLEQKHRRVCSRCLAALRPPPPPLCARCGLPLGSRPPRTEACEECREWPEILIRARSAVLLESPADRLVHGLKYGGWRDLGTLLGKRMARVRFPAPPAGKPSVVVPVPTTRIRRRRRGYNQAAVLAEAVGSALGCPVVRALHRRPGARSQVALQPLERGHNVLRAFEVRGARAAGIGGRHVVLVDDVLTTGATVVAASKALGRAGVARVSVLTFARAVPFRGA